MKEFMTIFFILFGGLGLIASCAPASKVSASNVGSQAQLVQGDIQEFNLQDGTHCVIYNYHGYAGGITCNWKPSTQ